MTWYHDPVRGQKSYIRKGKRIIYAEWDGTKWNELPWPKRK